MVTVSNVLSKYISEDDDDVSVSFKVDVENKSKSETVYVELQGLDAEGFEVDSFTFSSTVSVGSKKSVTAKTYVSKDNYKNIVQWQTK